MADREKVIKELEEVKEYIRTRSNGSGSKICRLMDVCNAAIILLKEQEAKWIHREDMDFIDKYNCTHFHGMCTNCGLVHDFIDGHTGQYLYCPHCGRAVKWDG